VVGRTANQPERNLREGNSLIDRYVGWVPILIAVGAISVVCVLAFVSIGLADRRGEQP
jgi:hypothetical protein